MRSSYLVCQIEKGNTREAGDVVTFLKRFDYYSDAQAYADRLHEKTSLDYEIYEMEITGYSK
jgi:hypothetical protein